MRDTSAQRRLASSLSKHYQEMVPSTLAFAHIMLAASAILLWGSVDTEALGLWAGVLSCSILVGTLLTSSASPDRFVRISAMVEGATSVGWAVFPLVALADTADWQVAQGMILIAVLLSTLGTTTTTRELHLASALPIGVIPAIVFTLLGDGAARWLWVLFAIALGFTLATGDALRQVQRDLFSSSVNNEGLATDLTHEGERLRVANRELEQANSHLDDLARRDPLTGLYNRAGFTDLLNQAVQDHPGKVMVCYADLDRFKRINDAFGHRFGDLVLAAAASRIRRLLNDGEIVARQGGDEFTIFGLSSGAANVAELGRRVLSAFTTPFMIENRQVELNVSVGLVWLPEITTAGDLMRFADTALYKAKDQGRGRYTIFNESMRAELDTSTQLQVDLGSAFERYEIVPYLQPVVDLATGEISSAEALARWEVNGAVRTASDFIDTARDLGLLDRINTIVAEGVLDFQRDCANRGLPICPIAVNVSPLHLELMVNRVLKDAQPDTIVFELTEDGIYSDVDHAAALLEHARRAGVQVLLDDFGVGFSSLSIATQIPIDGFKIDRGFVASLAGNRSAVAAVESIIQMADRMGLRVVAEGVETPQQLRLLSDLGVNYAQGYLFSQAVPFEQFAEWRTTGFQFDIERLSRGLRSGA